MIAWVIAASARNRALVGVLALIGFMASAWAIRATPIDALPDLSDTQVIVVTPFAGQAPQVVEDQVTWPMSTALLSVPQAQDVRGYSYFGLSMVYVIFEDGADLYDARSRVLEVLNVARDRLPEGVTPQLGPDATGVGWVYIYTLSEFSPRARVLRAALDADGDDHVTEAELPAPALVSQVGATRRCTRRLGPWCLSEQWEGGTPTPAYSEDQLRALFQVDVSPLGDSPADFADDSVRFAIDGFDRDGDGRLSGPELLRAADFQGLDLAQLRSIQDWYLRYDLTALEGVSEVASVGGFVKQYQVEVDPEKLRAFGVTLGQVRDAIHRANQEAGGRVIEMAETEFMVRGQGYIRSVDDLRTVPVAVDRALHAPVLLEQVAQVQIGPAPRRGLVEMNGLGEVVSGIVLMRVGENALDVIDRVEGRLDALKAGLPEGVEVHVSYDRSRLIRRAVAGLAEKLVEEIAVVALVCALFLLHARSAMVAVITLPLGVGLAFVAMRLMGLSADIMSLGGIAIAIGVMVDASVVMVENLHKHRERDPDADPLSATIAAATEVGPALFFSLLVVTVSFLPVFTLEQQEGRLFTPLAWTKTLSMAASALLAVTLIPALMVGLARVRVRHEADNPLSRVAIAAYRPLLRGVLKAPGWVAWAALSLAVISVVPLLQLGDEFLPPLNEGDLLYMPTTPPGLSITKARELVQQTDRLIAAHPQVRHVLGKVGRADTATDPAPLTMLETTILLEPEDTWPEGKTLQDIIAELDARVRIPGLTNAWTMPIRTRIDMLATGIRTPVGVKVMGDDLAVLSEVGQQVEATLRDVPGTHSVFSERVVGGNYVDIRVRRADAARYGLNVADVQDVVRSAIGGSTVTRTVEGLERYDVVLRFPRELRDDVEQLRRVAVPTPLGHTVPLAQVADLALTKGPPAIKSEDARRTAWIYVDIDTSDVGGYVERAREAVNARVRLPPGVSLVWSGQYAYMERANARLAWVLPVTLALIFVLLYLHFRRAAPTALVMASTLLFAPIGGIWLLYALDYNLSVAVRVGFIALMGLAAETGVVMLVYLDEAADRFEREGRLTTRADLRAAVMEGAVERVRPKLMTVTTTILGLLPVMVSTATGAAVMKRVAAPMVGGLVSSTALTLIVLPALYLLWRGRRLQA
ncbi:MAG: efflux RND transporter permease subunit [Alphaproteobacteria bacterium]|nr:efflux RND transporter permease subunit [Alphaproteobacteria bacterium]